MRKFTSLFLLLIIILTLSSCTKTSEIEKEIVIEPFLDIYYINDFHGAILPSDDQIGMSNIANFINTKKEANPNNVIVLAGGDILQGSALSNYYSGLSTINMMNLMQFDAFTLGNHEFDWGLEAVTNYFDGNEANGEANFPLLGANVFLEGTEVIPDNIEPYTIIERGNVKIGIIGTMGFGLEYSIAASKIDGYDFGSPIPIIEEYAYQLRTVDMVDIVIVVSHDSGKINSGVAALTGDYKVDAIFNAHSHNEYAHTDFGIPVIQSGSNGEYVGHVRFDLAEGDITTSSAENLSYYDSALFQAEDEEVQNLIETYLLETDELFNTPILVSGEDLSRDDLSRWIAKLMRVTSGSDIAFHNLGGTRTEIDDSEMIDLGLLYQVWPFDNIIKTVYLSGAQINNYRITSSDAYDTEITTFEDDEYYKVATNDYVFDKDYNPFVYGQYSENTGLLLRDIAVSELELQNLLYSSFLSSNDILSVSLYPDEVNPFISPTN